MYFYIYEPLHEKRTNCLTRKYLYFVSYKLLKPTLVIANKSKLDFNISLLVFMMMQ